LTIDRVELKSPPRRIELNDQGPGALGMGSMDVFPNKIVHCRVDTSVNHNEVHMGRSRTVRLRGDRDPKENKGGEKRPSLNQKGSEALEVPF